MVNPFLVSSVNLSVCLAHCPRRWSMDSLTSLVLWPLTPNCNLWPSGQSREPSKCILFSNSSPHSCMGPLEDKYVLKPTSSTCAAAARAERVFTSCSVGPFGVVLLLICASALQLHCCLALLGAEPFAHLFYSLWTVLFFITRVRFSARWCRFLKQPSLNNKAPADVCV